MSRPSLSDFPPPSRHRETLARRVVTIGGGHGQAALLGALTQLSCEISAVVSVADDGGCSGKLREELGMAPPGDIRRCLVALATRHELARRFEERISEGPVSSPSDVLRSVGNLVLAEMTRDLGSLSLAVEWAAALLGCVGRVIPVAEEAGVLRVYDAEHGELEGESNIERRSGSPVAVNVEGPSVAHPEAHLAIMNADLVLIGPGSFVGSTLAAITTGDLARSLVKTRARRVFVMNLEREESVAYGIDEHERILRDHIIINSGGDTPLVDVMTHTQRGHRADVRGDGSTVYASSLVRAGEKHHDPSLLAEALREHFGLGEASRRDVPDVDQGAQLIFEDALTRARRRLAET